MRLYVFPILRWGNAFCLFEYPAEIQRIIIPDNLCDFIDVVLGVMKKCLCIKDTLLKNVLHRCRAGIKLEVADKPACTDMEFFGIGFDVERFTVMLVKVSNGSVDFLCCVGIVCPYGSLKVAL